MTDDPSIEEGAEEGLEDLEAPAERAGDVVGGLNCPHNTACNLPTQGCAAPTCTGQTWCLPGTHQGCQGGTCEVTFVRVS